MEQIKETIIGKNRGITAQHNVRTSLNTYYTGKLHGELIEREEAWRTMQFVLSYIPVAMALELPTDQDFGGGQGSEYNMLPLLVELHYLKYEGSNLEEIYRHIFEMRDALLQKSESLIAKIVLLNTFEVKSVYKEHKLHEQAIEVMKLLNKTHDTFSIEVDPIVSMEFIRGEIAFIRDKQGLHSKALKSNEQMGESMQIFNSQKQLLHTIIISLLTGEENNVLVLSISRGEKLCII